jgi:PIN domain nuclease of toxin-antitoxin system
MPSRHQYPPRRRKSVLPWHHRDPFDRQLVSQHQAIPVCLLTTNELLAKYSDLVRVVVPQ